MKDTNIIFELIIITKKKKNFSVDKIINNRLFKKKNEKI